MKIRSGFVSNSSTSSFVVIGVKIPKISEAHIKLIAKEYGINFNKEDDDYVLYEGLDEKFGITVHDSDHDSEDKPILGYRLASSDCDCFENVDISFEKLKKSGDDLIKELGPFFKIIGKTPEVKLYIGTESC